MMALPPLYDESDYEALREEKDKRIAELEAENKSLYETASREAGTVTAFMTHQDTYNKVLRDTLKRAEQAEADLAAMTSERDTVAKAVRELCDKYRAEDLDELESVIVEKSWDGLMAILDGIYPESVFTGASGDPGPAIVVLTRKLAAMTERAEAAEPVEEFTAFCDFPAECPKRVPGSPS